MNDITAVTTLTLRPATDDDVVAVAELWHDAWLDGHRGHVPVALLDHRRPADFLARVPDRLDATTVAVDGSAIVGFVTVIGDEVEQLFVASAARGGDEATALLDHGEALVATHHDVAWLAVVPGNTRARRFYAKRGWRDTGPIEQRAEIAGGTMVVPSLRYEKQVNR